MITKEELLVLRFEIESDRIEKTISLKDSKKIGEAICSFANDYPNHQKPGYLFIGVNDDGSLNGTPITDQTLQFLMDFRSDGRIVPPPAMNVGKFSFLEGEVAVVEVQPSHQPPVRFDNRICVRIGPRKSYANEAEERSLSEKRSYFARSFDTWPCLDSSLKDLSLELFKTSYLPSAIDEETLLANHRDVSEQLASLKLFDLKANCPSYAGIILLGTNPEYFLPGAYIQYVRFDGLNEASDPIRDKKFSGDLISVLKNLDDFIKSAIVEEKSVPTSVLKEGRVFNYPFYAIREALMNAIMHRDYQSSAPIRFYEFSDKIQISNHGGLYGHARPDNFPRENDYRNPTLAEALKNLGYVNRFKRGIIRIKAELKNNGSLEPEFIFNEPMSFGVIMYKNTL